MSPHLASAESLPPLAPNAGQRVVVFEVFTRPGCSYSESAGRVIDYLSDEYGSQPVVFLEQFVDSPVGPRLDMWWSAHHGYRPATLPLVMVDSGHAVTEGPVDYYKDYKVMVEASRQRPPQAELSVSTTRVNNRVRFSVRVTNGLSVSLSETTNGAQVHGIVYEITDAGLTGRVVRASVVTGISPDLPPGASATLQLETPDLSGVNWNNLHFLAIADYLPSGSSGAYDVLQAATTDTTPPTEIVRLFATPTQSAGEAFLSWTAPSDGGGRAAAYDLRYSSSVITEANWGNATEASGEPRPGLPGDLQFMTVANLATGTRWYFAIKSVDRWGNWSSLSNVPSLQDLGFRVGRNGYGFSNSDGGWGQYPNSPANGDFTDADLRRMFGDAAVCWMVGEQCLVLDTARAWLEAVNRDANRGHCDGFTTTSLRFFKRIGDPPSAFRPSAGSIRDLGLADARRHISYFQALQYSEPVSGAKGAAVSLSVGQTLDRLRSAMSGDASNPTALILRRSDHRAGHSLTPYALEELGSGEWRIWVYDNNHPDDGQRTVRTNTTENTWSYGLGWEDWSGTGSNQSFGAVPISAYAGRPSCPWCRRSSLQTSAVSPHSQTFLTPGTRLLATDGSGHRLGYVDGQLVDEMADGFALVVPGGLASPKEPIFFLPSGSITLSIRGEGGGPGRLTQIGPGYADEIAGLDPDVDRPDALVISQDGRAVSFEPGDSRVVDFSMALDDDMASHRLQLSGVDLAGGRPVTLAADASYGVLSYTNRDGGPGEYDLAVSRLDAGGRHTFRHPGVPVLAGDTHPSTTEHGTVPAQSTFGSTAAVTAVTTKPSS